MSGYSLDKEQKEEVMSIIKKFLIDSDKIDCEDVELDIDKLFIGMSPAQLDNILESLGYTQDEFDDNGWDWSFWSYYSLIREDESTKGLPEKVAMTGCGWGGELQLRNSKFDE